MTFTSYLKLYLSKNKKAHSP